MNYHTHQIYGSINISPQNTSHTHSFNPNYVLSPPISYSRDIAHGILHSNNIILEHLNQQAKEQPMSTLDKIRAERREKREREELEAKFEAWDAAIGSATEGDIYAFSLDMSNKTYRYAVIYVDKRWHLTGQTTCAMATEDFIAWLIGKDAEIQNLIYMEPLT